ncbi:MAG: hypothetical protein Q9M21_08730 [Mariprofundaceae bacterium]|nr:hypothetical protein [Mariprofundaceae bacterium]
MKKAKIIGLLMGTVLVAAPVAYGGENHAMSDAQHRKTMGGMHHPEQNRDAVADKKRAMMSNAQHRKTMGGMRHPEQSRDAVTDKKRAVMSDAQHRKTMGGSHHPK